MFIFGMATSISFRWGNGESMDFARSVIDTEFRENTAHTEKRSAMFGEGMVKTECEIIERESELRKQARSSSRYREWFSISLAVSCMKRASTASALKANHTIALMKYVVGGEPSSNFSRSMSTDRRVKRR